METKTKKKCPKGCWRIFVVILVLVGAVCLSALLLQPEEVALNYYFSATRGGLATHGRYVVYVYGAYNPRDKGKVELVGDQDPRYHSSSPADYHFAGWWVDFEESYIESEGHSYIWGLYSFPDSDNYYRHEDFYGWHEAEGCQYIVDIPGETEPEELAARFAGVEGLRYVVYNSGRGSCAAYLEQEGCRYRVSCWNIEELEGLVRGLEPVKMMGNNATVARIATANRDCGVPLLLPVALPPFQPEEEPRALELPEADPAEGFASVKHREDEFGNVLSQEGDSVYLRLAGGDIRRWMDVTDVFTGEELLRAQEQVRLLGSWQPVNRVRSDYWQFNHPFYGRFTAVRERESLYQSPCYSLEYDGFTFVCYPKGLGGNRDSLDWKDYSVPGQRLGHVYLMVEYPAEEGKPSGDRELPGDQELLWEAQEKIAVLDALS